MDSLRVTTDVSSDPTMSTPLGVWYTFLLQTLTNNLN